jgi:hypothetical protein
MKYIGNYAEWIRPEWVDYLMNNTGFERPGSKVLENEFEAEQNNAVSNNGYANDVYWYKFTPENFPFDVTLPIEGTPKIWWFVKMVPGNLIPMHIDQDIETGKRTKLYWMSLVDYAPGHLIVCKDQLLVNYKKGDLYMFDDANDLHGSCNIGFSPRLIFNFTFEEQL